MLSLSLAAVLILSEEIREETIPVPLSELSCVIESVAHEAMGEPKLGKQAVANVIQNRLNSGKFGDSYCDVIRQPKQFSYANDGAYKHFEINNRLDAKAFRDVVEVSVDLVQGKLPDITYGSTHYYAHDKVTPYWSSYGETVTILAGHTFVRNVKNL